MALTLTAGAIAAGWTLSNLATSGLTNHLDYVSRFSHVVPRIGGTGYIVTQVKGVSGSNRFFVLPSDTDGQVITNAEEVPSGTNDFFFALANNGKYYGRGDMAGVNRIFEFTENGSVFTPLVDVVSEDNEIIVRKSDGLILYDDDYDLRSYNASTATDTFVNTIPGFDVMFMAVNEDTDTIYIAQVNNQWLYSYDISTGVQLSGIFLADLPLGYLRGIAVLRGTLDGNLLLSFQNSALTLSTLYMYNIASGVFTQLATSPDILTLSAYGEGYVFVAGSNFVDRLTLPATSTVHVQRSGIASAEPEPEPEPGYTIIELPADDSAVIQLPADDSGQACLPDAAGHTQVCLPAA